ncbi:MAG: ABC transporter ATP-binding protein [Pseudomonadota bacterium]
MNAAELTVNGVSWAPRKRAPLILQPTSFTVSPGAIMGIVGPNGAGKSTLLRLLYRYQAPLTGQVHVGGDDIWAMPPRAAARRIAAVLQEQPTDFGLTVREIVALGRTPHRLGFATEGARDGEVIESVLARLDLTGLGARTLATLSGGERQRVMMARALAQEPQVLILDEPTNHLDIRHQLDVLHLVRNLDLTIVTSLHDLNMAADICDHVLILQAGHPVAQGAPHEVLSEDAVSNAFDIIARRENLAPSNTDHLTFHLPN